MKRVISIPSLFVCLLFLVTAISGCSETSNSENASVTESNNTMATIELDVYKTETCGCCGIWVEHMTANNFNSTIHHPNDLNAVKLQYGIDPQWQSCHTAVSKEGYVFEGHVPAKFVQQFLENPPLNAVGLAVPGMPLGSPGMEVGDRFNAYDIQLLKKDGSTEVYASIGKQSDQF